MKLALATAALLLGFAGVALGNDTMSQLGAGGLVFLTSPNVAMQSEDLSISLGQVKVVYQFHNNGAADEQALVAFPLPDITGNGDFMVSIPTEDPDNLFGFTASFDGKPVDVELHQYVFAVGVDQTALLMGLDIPFEPFGAATIDRLNALPDGDKQQLIHLGMVIPMEYDAGNGMQTDLTPIWTLKSTYTWEAEFKAGETAEVVHSYKPSIGGTTAVTFLTEGDVGYDPAGDYKKRYCTDEQFVSTVEKTLPDPKERYGAPFSELWLSYIWSTGANWSGPIGKFHLTIDKGRPENLVSFCWDGEVKKTSPTTFEMDATDFYPPADHELEILILNRQDPEPDVG